MLHIGSVNLGRLDELGNLRNFPKNSFQTANNINSLSFYRAKRQKNFTFLHQILKNDEVENLMRLNLISRYEVIGL
jgi:hypothetical protein